MVSRVLAWLSATLAATVQLLRSNSRTAVSPACPEPSYPLLASSSQERSEYEFEEVSPACLGYKVPTKLVAALAWHLVRSHGKSAPSLAVRAVGMIAIFIATTRSDVEETSKHGLEDVSPTSLGYVCFCLSVVSELSCSPCTSGATAGRCKAQSMASPC